MHGVIGFLTETGEEAKFSTSAGVGSAPSMGQETGPIQVQDCVLGRTQSSGKLGLPYTGPQGRTYIFRNIVC